MKEQLQLKEMAYKQIKEKIILGELTPGTYIKEKDLIEVLEVSRTPLREAVGKLEQEGWLEIVPGKGLKIIEFSLKYIKEIFEMRKNFEPNILKISFGNISDFELKFFREQFSNIDDEEEADKIDDAFHGLLLNSSHNRYLIKTFENIYEHTRRIRKLSPKPEVRKNSAKEEHLQIIDFLLEKNLNSAIEILEKHIDNSQISFMKNMKIIHKI